MGSRPLRKRVHFSAAKLVTWGALAAWACSGGPTGRPPDCDGMEGCVCRAEDACDPGLECRSDLCVVEDDQPTGGKGVSGNGQGGADEEGGSPASVGGVGGELGAATTGGTSARGGGQGEGGTSGETSADGGTSQGGASSGGEGPGASSGMGGEDSQGGSPQGGAGTGGVAQAGRSGGGGTVPGGLCDVSQPFVEVTEVPGLNTEHHEGSPRLTPDELAVVFYSRQPDDDGVTDADVYFAERGSVDEPFGAPEPLPFNQEERDEMGAWISDDRLTVLFDFGSARSDGADYARTVAISERDSADALFGPEQELGAGFDPFVVGGADGTLYFLNPSQNGGLNQDSLSDWSPLGDPFEVVAPVSQRFAISSDQLTVYFGDGPSGPEGIQIATRTNTSQAFDPAVPSTELDSFNPLGAGWLSPDQCRLYFNIDLDGVSGGNDGDIMLAKRDPP